MQILAPVQCLECGKDDAVLCTTCIEAVSSNRYDVCYSCGRVSVGARTCELCRPSTQLGGVSVGAAYEGAVKDLIWKLKFHRLRAATEAAALIVLREAGQWPAVEVVTSVPVAAVRYRERGYNQSELVAREVARRVGLPYSPALGRLTSTHQVGLDRRTRLEQISGAFYATRRLEGQHVLLVDDVVTTGATLSECALVLRASGAASVWGAAVARH